MYYYSDEFDEDYESENDIIDITSDNDTIFEKNMEIIKFYKDKLTYEPTFISINNISSFTIYEIITNAYINKKMYKYNNISNTEYNIIYDLLIELNIKKITDELVNNVANIIYYKLYI